MDIDEIRSRLVVKYPAFASIIVNHPFVESVAVNTACTDGNQILYNPGFAAGLSEDEQLFLLAHEVCHIAFKHIERSKGKDQKIWNIATDAVVNAYLHNDGLPIIKGGIDIPEAINYDAETMYNKLLEDKEKEENKEQESDKSESGNNNSEGQSSEGDSSDSDEKENNESNSDEISDDNSSASDPQSGQGDSEGDPNENENQQENDDSMGLGTDSGIPSSSGGGESSDSGGSSSSGGQEDQNGEEKENSNSSESGDSSGDDQSEQGSDEKSEGNSSGSGGSGGSDSNSDNENIEDEEKSSGETSDENSSGEGNLDDKEESSELGHDSHAMWAEAVKNKKENKDSEKEENKEEEKNSENIDERKIFEDNKKEREENAKEYLKDLTSQSLNAGSNEYDGYRYMEDIGESKQLIDWRRLLRETLNYDEDWSYKNAEIEDGIVRSKLEEFPVPETEILLDVSGSVDDDLIRCFLRECKHILKNSRMKVGTFDTRFHDNFTEIRKLSDIDELELESGGGTDFKAAVQGFSRKADNKIIFTDGYADVPQEPMNIIWVVFGDKEIYPPGGKVIHVNEDDLRKINFQSKEKGFSK